MATNSDEESAFHKVLGLALINHDYRAELTNQAEPEVQKAALARMGVTDPEAALPALNASIDAINSFSQQFGTGVTAA